MVMPPKNEPAQGWGWLTSICSCRSFSGKRGVLLALWSSRQARRGSASLPTPSRRPMRSSPHRIRRGWSQRTALRMEPALQAPLAPTACFASRTYARGFAVQHLVSQIRGSLVQARIPPTRSPLSSVDGRFPSADHSWQVAGLTLMPYLMEAICPGIGRDANRRRRRLSTPLPERSKLVGGRYSYGSPSPLCRCRQPRPAAPYRTPLS